MNEQNYNVGIGLSVVPYVGPDLYSNVPAVISELIANAWDAGATKVSINIAPLKNTIVIEDNGIGMSLSALNSRYLRIGYKKRLLSDTTLAVNGKQRHVMGRKGIGKLAPFALAEVLEIQSSDGQEKVGCIIEWSKFKTAIDGDATVFSPAPLTTSEITVAKGTRLTLHSIRDDKQSSFADITKLRKQIARRFTIINPEHDFNVEINDISITDKDRPYLSKLEFLWSLGNSSQLIPSGCTNLLRPIVAVGNSITIDRKTYKLSGWVGTVEKPADIYDDNNNTIAIFAHGKMVQEDILGEMEERRLFANYVVGDIQADFLDYDDEDDIVTPDRQRLNQSDPRYIKLKEYIKSTVLNEIPKNRNWDVWRKERHLTHILELPNIKEWYEKLTPNDKITAADILRKLFDCTSLDDDTKERYCNVAVSKFGQLKKINGLTKLPSDKFIESLEQLSRPQAATTSNSRQTNSTTTPDSTARESTKKSAKNEVVEDNTSEDNQASASSDNSASETPPLPSTYTEQSDVQQEANNEPSENERPEGNRPTHTRSPAHQADFHFGEIRRMIRQLNIEQGLKDVALFDLNDAKIAYNNTAYKACIVMLGAILEGIMLGILRRQDVLQKFNQMPSSQLPKFLLNIGIIRQPLDVQEVAEAIAVKTGIGFEEYRQGMMKLVPDIENQLVVNIQRFRNSIHPYKAVSEPALFGSPDATRAMNYITSLEIIIKQVVLSIP